GGPGSARLCAGPGTGSHWSLPAADEYSEKLSQCAPYAAPSPPQLARSAKARLPAVSRPVTLSPEVCSCRQWPPLSWLTHSCGPKAQPSLLRKRIWLTPVAPRGAPVSGALTPYQLAPQLDGPASDVQERAAHPARAPAPPT